MASFDIIEAAGNGYRIVWEERRYLLRLALVPVMIKFVCMVAGLSLGLEQNMLLQTLISLPAFFAEGWLLAHFCRLMFLGQRWPFQPGGDPAADEIILRERFRGVMGGMLTYVVTCYAMGGMFYFLLKLEEWAGGDTQEPQAGMLFLAFALMGFMIWAFRLVWLFIPAALNYRMLHYLRVFSGFVSSFYMIGVWLVCFVPIMFCYQFVAELLLGGMGDGNALRFLVLLGQSFLGIVTTLIATAGIGSGIRAVMLPDPAKKQ